MTTTSDCITYSRHTEQHDGQTVHITRWGTERMWIEYDRETLWLLAHDKNGDGPFDLWVDTEHLRELHQVLGWFLMNYTHQGESLTLADVQAMNPAALLGREVQR